MKKTCVSCPTCQTEVIWNAEAKYRPFCSERCKLIDLGAWASDEHSIASEDTSWLNPEEELN